MTMHTDAEWNSMLSSLCQISHVQRQAAAVADADQAWREWIEDQFMIDVGLSWLRQSIAYHASQEAAR